ncbi:hypothetical protein XENTR_v10017938 [Xenopus tropicalis]|nr:hypothetical protein XENTR_v10017938 [Xenopus tropicalis]
MLGRVAFVTLVLLCLVQEDSCFSCPNSENLPKDLKDLVPLTDKVQKAVTKILNGAEDLKNLKEYETYFQNQICTNTINSKLIPMLKITFENLLTEIKEGTMTKEDLAALFQGSPSELFESMAAAGEADNTEDEGVNDTNTWKEE